MNQTFKEDDRDKLWATLEAKIQNRAKKKDSEFVLVGKWKKFLREQDGFKIFEVDGEWVRNNLSVIFEHGGHGYVFEFISLSEIWVETHHPKDCGCKDVREDRKISQQYSDSVVIHEITEFKEMEKGLNYWEAHQIAQKKELDAGLLKDPYTEVN